MEIYSLKRNKNPCDMSHCPSVDVMMKSIAEAWTGKILGVIMTGMGQDVAEGINALITEGPYHTCPE
jgi:chemotaxis response regulator CheB